jgi:3-hydroxybutyryl-CoA dehydrogenase
MKEVKNILICGGGMMGKGIAHVLSVCDDYRITVYDVYDSPFQEGLKSTFQQLVDKRIITEEEVMKRISRVSFTTDLESSEIKAADLVIECVFEKLDIKQDMFAKLEERCSVDTIFCTNTLLSVPLRYPPNWFIRNGLSEHISGILLS